jgi:hypothetical protein
MVAGGEQRLFDRAGAGDSHVEGERGSGAQVVHPVGRGIAGAGLAGGDDEGVGHAALDQEAAECGAGGGGGGNPGDDLPIDAGGVEGRGFFGAPGEDAGVAALEADDAFALAGGSDHQRVDAAPRPGVVPGDFPT